MPSRKKEVFHRAVRWLSLLSVTLLAGPVAVDWVVHRSVGTLETLFSTRITEDAEFQVRQVLASRIVRQFSLAVSEYRGAAFVRTSIPVRFLGITLQSTERWMHIPGIVRASIDLIDLDPRQLIAFTDTGVHVTLPHPEVTSCELDLEQAVGGVSYGLLPIESIQDIAAVEESMYVEACSALVEQALQSGIIAEAELNTNRAVETAVQAVIGDQTPIEIRFLEDSPRVGLQL